ncbi:MAG: hypothetical protein JNL47_10705 [Bacteroidia bacterium]|nr:hypothetical protein [Bacteroidia bacterium]
MKSGIALLVIFLLTATGSHAQNALEGIIIEKYYISDENDSKAEGAGYLPPGSVTYRIYIDLATDCKLHAVYGVEGHDLIISTTTAFFNHEMYGAVTSNEVLASTLMHNLVMLDSWLSVGAGASVYFALPKSKDDEKNTTKNNDGFLQNNHPDAGIPLKERDGLMYAYPQLAVNFYGIDDGLKSIFGKTNSRMQGQEFKTNNGSWACFGGAYGPDKENLVCIAQLTTDGELYFELNIQLGKPDGTVENYVARNPQGNEKVYPQLIFRSSSLKAGQN